MQGLSVVIPALNEAAHIEACLASVGCQSGDGTVVVVDGGSQDDTARLARRQVAVVVGPRGRAAQMNLGARLTTGDSLLFLHADSVLAPGALAALDAALAAPDVAGGTFTLRFDTPHPVLRLYAVFSRLPHRFFHYGDQGIFVRRAVFDALTGFRDWPLMEDVDFLARLETLGRRVVVPLPVTTSARRYLKRGVVRQQLLNGWLLALYGLGVPPTTLARWYR